MRWSGWSFSGTWIEVDYEDSFIYICVTNSIRTIYIVEARELPQFTSHLTDRILASKRVPSRSHSFDTIPKAPDE